MSVRICSTSAFTWLIVLVRCTSASSVISWAFDLASSVISPALRWASVIILETCSRTSASFLFASASAASIWSLASDLRRESSSLVLLRWAAICAVAVALRSDSSRSCAARSEASFLSCSSRELLSSSSTV